MSGFIPNGRGSPGSMSWLFVVPPNKKQGLLASEPGKFFTSDHYRGFPAVLVYLDCVDEWEFRSLLTGGLAMPGSSSIATAARKKQLNPPLSAAIYGT
jgi:hypothetical protein